MTLEVFIGSAALAAVSAFLLGFLRHSRYQIVRIVTTGCVEFFRGTSSLVQLFWLYFALPFFGVSLSAVQAAIIGLGLVHGAYGSEVVRGALGSIPREQWEAATALSMTRRQAFLDVILPQAFLAMLPPFGNALVLLLKGTSLASIITVPELTFQGSVMVTQTLATAPVFTCVLIIYYVLAIGIDRLTRFAEGRLGRWRPQV